jgi:hypothetical protein
MDVPAYWLDLLHASRFGCFDAAPYISADQAHGRATADRDLATVNALVGYHRLFREPGAPALWAWLAQQHVLLTVVVAEWRRANFEAMSIAEHGWCAGLAALARAPALRNVILAHNSNTQPSGVWAAHGWQIVALLRDAPMLEVLQVPEFEPTAATRELFDAFWAAVAGSRTLTQLVVDYPHQTHMGLGTADVDVVCVAVRDAPALRHLALVGALMPRDTLRKLLLAASMSQTMRQVSLGERPHGDFAFHSLASDVVRVSRVSFDGKLRVAAFGWVLRRPEFPLHRVFGNHTPSHAHLIAQWREDERWAPVMRLPALPFI